MLFAIVQFIDEEDLPFAVVPQVWLSEGMCYWPPFNLRKKEKGNNLAIRCTPPHSTWEKHNFKFMKGAESWQEAMRYLVRFQTGSSIETTDDDKKRKRKRISNSKYRPQASSDEEESSLPDAPAVLSFRQPLLSCENIVPSNKVSVLPDAPEVASITENFEPSVNFRVEPGFSPVTPLHRAKSLSTRDLMGYSPQQFLDERCRARQVLSFTPPAANLPWQHKGENAGDFQRLQNENQALREENQALREENQALRESNAQAEKDPEISGKMKPWRNVQWTASRREELMKMIRNYKPLVPSVSRVRILMVGPVGAGKSSFFNSINSIFMGRMTSKAMSGSAGTSLTTQFRTYPVKDGREGKPLPFVLCDTMGLEEQSGAGLDIDDISSILQGHVPDRYKFNPITPFQPDEQKASKPASPQEKIHCVVYVIDATKISLMSSKLEEKLATIRKKVNSLGIPQTVLMTKVDEACPLVEKDLQNVYVSSYIKTKVQEVSSRLGVPVSCVLPVKNYSQELELELNCDVLLLTALQQMLNFADDYLDDVAPF